VRSRLTSGLVGILIAAMAAALITYVSAPPAVQQPPRPPAAVGGAQGSAGKAVTAPSNTTAGTGAPAEPPRDIRDVTPQGIPHVYMPEAVRPGAPRAERSIKISDAAVTGSGAIDGHGGTVQLYGIAFPEGNKICATASGERWPCGRRAYIVLHNKVVGQTVTCAPRAAVDPPAADCFLGDVNLAAWLLGQGLVRVAPDVADRDLVAAEAAAKKAKLGLWLDPRELAAASAQGR
jgi:endonuclease YncB( thermonuclease family)